MCRGVVSWERGGPNGCVREVVKSCGPPTRLVRKIYNNKAQSARRSSGLAAHQVAWPFFASAASSSRVKMAGDDILFLFAPSSRSCSHRMIGWRYSIVPSGTRNNHIHSQTHSHCHIKPYCKLSHIIQSPGCEMSISLYIDTFRVWETC